MKRWESENKMLEFGENRNFVQNGFNFAIVTIFMNLVVYALFAKDEKLLEIGISW